MALLLVVYCLSYSLNHEHLKGMNQAVFIFVFLASRAVPGLVDATLVPCACSLVS